MSVWTNIHRDFYDVPRMVVATSATGTFLFWSRFDDEREEYNDHYEVWSMPPLSERDLSGSWVGLEQRALGKLPDISIGALPFIVERV